MRLVGGHSVKEGRVQLCYRGEWHSVCADSWSESGSIEARTICSSLGDRGDSGICSLVHMYIHSLLLTVIADFGRDHAPLFPMDIWCNGVEDELSMCSFANRSGAFDCQKVAGVICDGWIAFHTCNIQS